MALREATEINKWLNNNWFKADLIGKWLLFSDIQSKRGNQRDDFWLARVNLAMHFDRSKTVGVNLLRGLPQGLSDGFSIGSYEKIYFKKRESFNPSAAWFESGEMRFSGKKSLRRWSRSNIDSTLVPLLRGTVNSDWTSLKLALKILLQRQKDDNLP